MLPADKVGPSDVAMIVLLTTGAVLLVATPAVLIAWIVNTVGARRAAVGAIGDSSSPAMRPASPGNVSVEKALQLTRERDAQREKILAQTGKNPAMIKAELEMLDKAYERKLAET